MAILQTNILTEELSERRRKIQEREKKERQRRPKTSTEQLSVMRDHSHRPSTTPPPFSDTDFPEVVSCSADSKKDSFPVRDSSPDHGPSFASMAKTASSSTVPWSRSPGRKSEDYEEEEEHGWILDLEDMLMEEEAPPPGQSRSNRKGKNSNKKHQVLVSNGGARRRF